MRWVGRYITEVIMSLQSPWHSSRGESLRKLRALTPIKRVQLCCCLELALMNAAFMLVLKKLFAA